MGKYIQEKVGSEKLTNKRTGKALGENVEITYNIKRRNETQHLTQVKQHACYHENRMLRTLGSPTKIKIWLLG